MSDDDVKSEVGTAFGHETTQMLVVCMRNILKMTDASIEKGIVDRCKANNITFTPEARRAAAEKAWNAICRLNRKAQHDFMTRVVNEMTDVVKLYKESLMIFILSKYSSMPNSNMYKIDYHIPDIQTFLFRFMCKAGQEQVLWAGLKEVPISDQMILVKTLLRMVFLDVIRAANCVVTLKDPSPPITQQQQPPQPNSADFPAAEPAPATTTTTTVMPPPLPPAVIIEEEAGADSTDNLSANSSGNPFIKTSDVPVLDKSTTPAQVAAALAVASGDLKRDVLVPPQASAPVQAAAPAQATTPSQASATAQASAPAQAPASAQTAATAQAAASTPTPSDAGAATATATAATPASPTAPASPATSPTPTVVPPTSDAKALSMTGGEAGSSAGASASAFSFPTEVPAVSLLKLENAVDNAQQFVPALPLVAPAAVAKYTVDGAGGITDRDRQDNGLHLPMSDTSFGSEMIKVATIMPEQVANVITMDTQTPAVKPDDSITSRLPGLATVSTPVVPSA